MYLLKLFHESDDTNPVGAHMLSEGTTRVGRDPGSDWVIPDPECEVSRNHLELDYHGGTLLMRPLGANGVYADDKPNRLQTGEPVPLGLGDTFSFGKYRVVVDPLPFGLQSASGNHTMVSAAPFGDTPEVPSEWSDAVEPPPLTGDGSLLEAFCEGAKLDASAFSCEDPAVIMRRAGEIYRQMVLGLGDLMSERSSTKTQYRMDRTTIGAQDNNPFKWAPTQRLATDLLLRKDAGFLSGAKALKESFEDVKQHLLCTLAGFRATVSAVLDMAAPAAIEQRIDKQSHFLKSRAASAWDEYRTLHDTLAQEVRDDRDGPINRAFIAAYDRKMDDIARGGEK